MRKVIFGILFAVVLMVFLMMVPAASTAANDEVCACEVVDYTQGIELDGDKVQSIRSILNNALGMPDAAPDPWRNFFSLGFASDTSPSGWMILKFCIPVSGQLTVYECSPTIQGNYPLETADVYVSQNGVDWTYLGMAKNNTSITSVQHPSTFDLGDLRIQYVKIVDTTDKGLHTGNADAFDIDAVCAEAPAPPECVDPPSSMVGWWPGDGTADDIVNNNDGTVYGAIFEAGKVGDAFSSFAGGYDRIDLGNPATLKQAFSHLTIDAWVKPSQYMLYGSVVSCTEWDGWAMRIGDGQLIADLRLTGGDVWLNAGTVPLNEWSHVAITYDQSIVRVFINGTEVGNAPGTGTIKNTLNASTNVFIGNEPTHTVVQPTYEFHGDIDEVEIFNRALSACEIQAIYFAGSAGKCKVIEVEIDIKPGSDPNSINLGEHGLLPVAILGSANFDVTEIDPETIAIGGISLASRGKKGKKLAYSYEDVDPWDENIDMMVFFDVQDLVEIGVLAAGTTELLLTANLKDGTPLEGTDFVNIVN